MSAEEPPASNLDQQVRQAGTFLTRSKSFKKLVKWAFEVCDADNSGAIGKPELYTGLLLVHVNCAKYAGPAACYPPTRERVEQLFDACDVDCSGEIDEEEFFQIMVILFSQVTSRIVVYYAILILLVPYLTVWTLDLLGIFHIGDVFMWVGSLLWDSSQTVPIATNNAPSSTFQYLVDMVPEEWFLTIMEQTVALVLFFLVIPTLFNKIDQVGYEAAKQNHSRQLARLVQLRNTAVAHRRRRRSSRSDALSLNDLLLHGDDDHVDDNNNNDQQVDVETAAAVERRTPQSNSTLVEDAASSSMDAGSDHLRISLMRARSQARPPPP